MVSELEQLLEMGCEKARAELAVKKTGGLQGALQWLEDNHDKPLDEIQAACKDEGDEADTKAQIAELETGQARSLVCNDCGKRFRSQDMASYHASRTEHTDFSESTEEIALLTDEEKKAKLEELRERLKTKKAIQSVQEKEYQKRNEKIRLKATQESQDAKEELQRKEQIREAARKRLEKLEGIEVRKRVKAQIEADKMERLRKAEEAKASREGRILDAPTASAAQPSVVAKPTTDRNEARLRLQTQSGTIIKTLPATLTLLELAQLIADETGQDVTTFTTTFPKKTFQGSTDMSKTLKEAGLVPSSVLIVK